MNTHLPKDLEQFVQAKVRSGRFSSSDEAIAEAVQLLRQREEAEEARVLEGIRGAWRTCGLGEDGPRRKCSRISGVSSIFPQTHDLPHHHRAHRRAGDPVRRPLEFPEEIRELLYGRHKQHKHRIIFTIRDDAVRVLSVRHSARDELEA